MNKPRFYGWADAAQDFVCACVIALVLMLVGFLALGAPGCRSAIPVTVLQNNFQCQSTNLNEDGSIEFHQCTRDGNSPVDLKQPVTGPTGQGDDKLDANIPGTAPRNIRN